MIDGVPAPVLITDPQDPRVADFRDLKAGDRPAGTPRGSGPVIVEGVPAVDAWTATTRLGRHGKPGDMSTGEGPRTPLTTSDEFI